jgi:cytochrome b561
LDSGGLSERARTIRQDLSFIVSILLLLAVVGAAMSGLAGDEDEFFGMGDDLHSFAGWSVVVLAGLHVLLCAGHTIRYAKRRLRRLVGVGAVVRSGLDGNPGAK